MEVRCLSSGTCKRCFASPTCPDWLREAPSVLLSGYRILLQKQSVRGLKLTLHLHLAPRLKLSGALLYTATLLHHVHSDNFSFSLVTVISGTNISHSGHYSSNQGNVRNKQYVTPLPPQNFVRPTDCYCKS